MAKCIIQTFLMIHSSYVCLNLITEICIFKTNCSLNLKLKLQRLQSKGNSYLILRSTGRRKFGKLSGFSVLIKDDYLQYQYLLYLTKKEYFCVCCTLKFYWAFDFSYLVKKYLYDSFTYLQFLQRVFSIDTVVKPLPPAMAYNVARNLTFFTSIFTQFFGKFICQLYITNLFQGEKGPSFVVSPWELLLASWFLSCFHWTVCSSHEDSFVCFFWGFCPCIFLFRGWGLFGGFSFWFASKA